MILVIDNYDSFTYNLVQALGGLGAELKVFRNDKISCEEAAEIEPDHLIVSPGPCTPKEAGVSCEIIKYFAGRIPVLGVCLGHQAIACAFGGEIVRAELPVHGKTSQIHHDGKGVFQDIANPFTATRYHSLLVKEDTLPDCFVVTSHTEGDNILMGIRHKDFLLEGVQFHPESFLTLDGVKLLENFIKIS